jgi:alpha-L-fucosidase
MINIRSNSHGGILFLFMLLFSFFTANSQIYVSVSGNDENQGTKQKPVASLHKALEIVKLRRDKGDISKINLFLRGGKYNIKKSIVLDSAVSNISIQPYENEKVFFSGGVSLPLSSLERIKLNGHDVYVIDIKKLGITDYGPLRNVGFLRPSVSAWGELFVNREPLHLARWPNEGMIPMGKVLDKGSVPRNGDFSDKGGLIKYDTARINSWVNEDEPWMSGYFMWGYADDMVRIAKIDTIKKTLKTASATLYGFGDGASFRRWCGVNILAELDTAGEFYVDRKKGLLYFMSDEEIRSLDFSILDEPVFTLEGAKNITIKGITFEYSRGAGMSMVNCENVTVRGCVFRNLGNLGIIVGKGIKPFKEYRHEGTGKPVSGIIGSMQSHMYENMTFNREGGKDNKITACRFYNLGAGGISLGGGDRLSLTPGNNVVENCVFHDMNRIEKSYMPAVHLTGVGNKIIHCEMYHTPSMAIYMHGNDHLIEYNYIHDVCLEVDDQGAIYYGRNPSERGAVVRYNYFENIPDHHRTCAVYHDDGACGMTVESNVFYKAGYWDVLIGGGSDNKYRNNIFIGSKFGIHIDNRLQNWGKSSLDKNGLFETRMKEVNYDKPPYSEHYPEIVSYFDDPSLPKNNVIENNVFYRTGSMIDGNKEWLVFKGENPETDDDLKFADESTRNFSLWEKSDVYKNIPGFKEIPFHKIGLEATPDMPVLRLRNGIQIGVTEGDRLKAWAEKQEYVESYTVTDPEVRSMVEAVKTDTRNAVFPNPDENARWFGNGNFGLFMHWGPSNIAGAQPSWAMIKYYPYGYEERFSDPENYFKLAKQFNPQKWDPDAICKAAKEAGMTYVVLTTKHHDGFALWPSKYGNYNIGTFFPGVDLLKPYVEACRKYGLKVGFYFSPRDWHFPDYPVGDQNFNYRTRGKYAVVSNEVNSERYDRWLSFTIGQLKELLTNYGEIDVLWFDGFYWPGKEEEAHTDALYNWIRSLQPGIVVNDRWYKVRNPDSEEEEAVKGDFATVEWKEPENVMSRWWEFCTSWGRSWGYSKLRFDAKEALRQLVLARSLGGNFLLNIGPSGEGLPPEGFYPYMTELAAWIGPDKEALFGKDVTPAPNVTANVMTTRKDGILCLHILPGDKNDTVIINDVGEVKKMKVFSTGKKIRFNKKEGKYIISKKKNKLLNDNYSVIEVYLKK